MALTTPLIYQALVSNRLSGGTPFSGPPFDTLALGIANGLMQWGLGQPANLALVGAATGTAGSGAIATPASRLIVPPTVGVVAAALSGAGLNGPLSLPLATVVALGVSQAFSAFGQYSGVAAGVGSGSDVSRIVVANAPTLVGTLELSLRSSLGAGPALSMFAMGLGNGIAALLLLGTGVAPIVGAVTPTPAAGVTTSVVV